MLSKEQAEVAAEAILQERRREQDLRAAKSARRRQPHASRRPAGIGALLGLLAGGLIGHQFAGDVFPAAVIGVFIGGALGTWRDRSG